MLSPRLSRPLRWAPLMLFMGALVLPSSAAAQRTRGPQTKAKPALMKAAVRKVARERSLRSTHPGFKTLGRKSDRKAQFPSKQVRRAEAKRERQHARIPKTKTATVKRMAKTGVGKRTLKSAAEHLELGMPTNADLSTPEDFLVVRNQYVLSYSKSKKIPNWVSWKLTAGDLGSGKRQKNFRADPTIPKHWGRATDADYKRSGYTRGHIVASGERQASTRANSKTFVFTNILPQIEANNGGPWLHLETHYREQAELHNQDVFVMAGGIFEGPARTIGENHVAVPSATWKVAVFVEKGQKLTDIDASTRVVSIVVPNVKGAVERGQLFTQFRVTPKQIEQRAGVKFFAHLPPAVRDALRNKMDTAIVGKGRGKRVDPRTPTTAALKVN
jgi:endonuclease G